jgi:hypothetical protein
VEQVADQGISKPRELHRRSRDARGDGVRFELATPANDAEIRRLLRENAIPGRISISLEREPDTSLAASVEGDVHRTIVARDPSSDRLIAMGSVSARDVYLNGRATRAGYLGQLRLDHSSRSRASILIGGYDAFRELHESLGVELYLTSIASDNARARRFLERGLPGMPTYRPLDTFVTSMIASNAVRWRLPFGLQIARAESGRLPEIIACLERNGRRYQFAPIWRELDLLERVRAEEIRFIVATRRERVVGCLAMWDQSAFKQAVIRGYDQQLARWRGWINFASRFMRVPELPPVGAKLNIAYLSHVAVDDDDADVFAGLLTFACDPGDRWFDDGGRGYFVLGLSERHPLLNAIPRKLRRHTYRTNLYAVHWEDGRAAAGALDGRPCQPEVALL